MEELKKTVECKECEINQLNQKFEKEIKENRIVISQLEGSEKSLTEQVIKKEKELKEITNVSVFYNYLILKTNLMLKGTNYYSKKLNTLF